MAQTSRVGAIPPPLGVEPNFEDPENRNSLIYAVFAACLTVSTACVALRLYTRFVSVKKHATEDYLIICGYLFAVVYFSMMPLGIQYGAGTHLWDMTPEKAMDFAKRSNMTDVIYSVTTCFVKLSIVAQIYHIFVPHRALKSKLFWVLLVTGALTIAFYTACVFYRIFACTPREKIWNTRIVGKCINQEAAILNSAVFNTAFDFLVLFIPMQSIWVLRMSTRKKIGVSMIFAVGFIACVFSIMRTIASIPILKSKDLTWNLIPVGAWCDAEIAAGIVCCCLPVCPQFYRSNISPLVTSLKSLRSRRGSYMRDSENPELPPSDRRWSEPDKDKIGVAASEVTTELSERRSV
ncbi:hypothetical protein BJ875DRAFT_520703 [Amylocarpus encephaloides]|uniref:Rhodopsin domain-containing protein n=1 Tax=Amylocarpus encephaloides TaxID=45428 RepID=A0A9P7YAQ1_9HELO|nr:hypothetical protein BJ875DRAFT_520703 [Amylocarpus encephaloides]